jgi:hypothetical protein
VSFLDYDFDDLARQVQYGLERLGINFLRSHRARVRRDLIDFHGYEQVDLELSHAGHTLRIHQAGRPRGFEDLPTTVEVDDTKEEFESTFDGSPAINTPPEIIAGWLASLPLGEAPPERKRANLEPTNPFAAERRPALPRLEPEPTFNPFVSGSAEPPGPNPFADPDRDRKRQEMLRRLRGEDE